MIVAWTGHRPYYFRDPRQARRAVEREARALRRECGADLVFLTGGQRGVDLWAAEAGFRLGVPVRVILPLPVQAFTQRWPRPEVERLERVLARAASVEVVASGGAGEPAHTERNRRLASGADLVVAVWTGLPGGGTWQTVQFARALGKPLREVSLPGSERPPRPGLRGL
ncbi:MAG: DUF1273 family protein [Chloroflexi bacterium]|nr:DUF1273 family protein [Chloroflexota bacterium]